MTILYRKKEAPAGGERLRGGKPSTLNHPPTCMGDRHSYSAIILIHRPTFAISRLRLYRFRVYYETLKINLY